MNLQSIVRRLSIALLAVVAGVVAGGCEADSWFETARVGYWEPTPVKMPILNRLDIINEPKTEPPGLTKVQPEDLIPEPTDYVIGSGDAVTISVFELMRPGIDTEVTRQVTDLGLFRHPKLGPIKVAGLTASELEDEVAQVVIEQGIHKEPEVHVQVVQASQRIFSIIGQPGIGRTRLGNYVVFKSDLRLLEAAAMAGGIGGGVTKVFIIRGAELPGERLATQPHVEAHEPAKNPGKILIDILEKNGEPEPQQDELESELEGLAPPKALERSLDAPANQSVWAEVDEQWVKVSASAPTAQSQETRAAGAPDDAIGAGEDSDDGSDLPEINQRVIEVPWDLLRKGDLRYNVVIRPGDIIRIPEPGSGFVFVGGSINRPGTYSIQGDDKRTIRQVVFAAGGLDALAIPERVDLTRRIGTDYEATVRLNLKAIFNGEEPDIFLKPDDTLNIGTNFFAQPIAVIRNGFRASYGFGFVLDRNFGTDVFGRINRNNN